jgi:hypothetical protein
MTRVRELLSFPGCALLQASTKDAWFSSNIFHEKSPSLAFTPWLRASFALTRKYWTNCIAYVPLRWKVRAIIEKTKTNVRIQRKEGQQNKNKLPCFNSATVSAVFLRQCRCFCCLVVLPRPLRTTVPAPYLKQCWKYLGRCVNYSRRNAGKILGVVWNVCV